MTADHPDWDPYVRGFGPSRAGDAAGETNTALGDPTRWGREESVQVGNSGTFQSSQVLRVQTNTPYPRNWSMLGNLTAPTSLWTDTGWAAFLQLTMGVGQTMLTQEIDLLALVTLAAPWYRPQIVGDFTTKSWVLPGGIVAFALSMRALHIVGSESFSTPVPVTLSAVISPFAADVE